MSAKVEGGAVTSKDGTIIAFDRRGDGPPLVLVDGAFCSRGFGPTPKLAPKLAERFTVFAYDRRGRGASGDTEPYAIDREVDDLEAVVGAAGGSPFVYGASSGAVLAVRAAARGVPMRRLAIYEPPIVLKDSPGPHPPNRTAEIVELVGRGDRSGAAKAFMNMVGVPAFGIFFMRYLIPGVWSNLTRTASTLPYDFAILGEHGPDKEMATDLVESCAKVKVPAIVGVGGKSPGTTRFTAEAFAKRIDRAELRVLDGETHTVSPKAIATLLFETLLDHPRPESAEAPRTPDPSTSRAPSL